MQDRFKFRVYVYGREDQGEKDKMFHVDPYYDSMSILLGADGQCVMQCTGIKDKNGKLIYEGDLFYFEIGGVKRLCSIEWHNQKCKFDFYEKSSGNSLVTYIDAYDDYEYEKYIGSAEVIGNIYENLDLLDNE